MNRVWRRSDVPAAAFCISLLLLGALFLVGGFSDLSLRTLVVGGGTNSSVTARYISGRYPHPRWRPKGAFISSEPLYESERVSIEEHTVWFDETSQYAHRPDTGVSKKNTVRKWLWVNQPDQINVLVHLGHAQELKGVLLRPPTASPPTTEVERRIATYRPLLTVPVLSSIPEDGAPNISFLTLREWLQGSTASSVGGGKENLFLMFRQRKYGYEGVSLGVVGGAAEPEDGGSIVKAAQRELREELRLEQCDTLTRNASRTRKYGLVHMGGFRVDNNRGEGVVHTFIASRCPLLRNTSFVEVPQPPHKDGQPPQPKKYVVQSAEGDIESQPVVAVTEKYLLETALYSQSESEISMHGSVKEIKWMGTVASALLQLANLNL